MLEITYYDYGFFDTIKENLKLLSYWRIVKSIIENCKKHHCFQAKIIDKNMINYWNFIFLIFVSYYSSN